MGDRLLGPVDDSDLVAGASRRQLLGLAATLAVRRGADMATAQLADPAGVLLLVAHVGFGNDCADHFAIIDGGRTPCSRAARSGRPVEVVDVRTDSTYDDEDRAILLATGSRSTTSFPVVDKDGHVYGVVSPHFFTVGPHDPDIAQPVVDRIGELAGHADDDVELRHGDLSRENLHLRRALTSRGVISVAKGILMATSKVDEDQAFAMLVRASQRENVKLRAICDRIVAGRLDAAACND